MRSGSVAGEGRPWTDVCNAVMSSFSGAWKEIEDSGIVLVRTMLVGVWKEAGGGVWVSSGDSRCCFWNIHVNIIHKRRCVGTGYSIFSRTCCSMLLKGL